MVAGGDLVHVMERRRWIESDRSSESTSDES